MSGLAARNVLIVEDEWLVRMELADAFEDERCTVLESASAESALTLLEEGRGGGTRIELLVTDIRLSGPLTGWDLAVQARGIDPDIAVIYVSANPPAPAQAVEGGVFIGKPAMIAQVLGEARRLLG